MSDRDEKRDCAHPSIASISRPVSSQGVDLTQIRALRALSPTERVQRLVQTVENLRKYRDLVRTV